MGFDDGRDRLKIISTVILTGFIAVSGGVDFFHVHHSGGRSHDQCPACQWNNLQKEDHSAAGSINDFIAGSITLICSAAAPASLIIPSDFEGKTIPSR